MKSFTGLNQRGSSLLFVIIITSVVLTGIMFTFDRLSGVAQFSSTNFKKANSNLKVESFLRSLVVLTRQYFQNASGVAEADYVSVHQEPLKAFIRSKLDSLATDGYTIKSWDVVIAPHANLINLPAGPFTGLESRVRSVQFSATVVSSNGVETSGSMEGTVGAIAAPQFDVFSFGDLSFVPIFPERVGRVHANGRAILGSRTGNLATASSGNEFLSIARLTSWTTAGVPGRYDVHGDPMPDGDGSRLFIATDDSGAAYKEMDIYYDWLGTVSFSSADNPYLLGNDTYGFKYMPYILGTFNGHFLPNLKFGVPSLRVLTAQSVKVQNNNEEGRFLADPILPSDDDVVRRQKLAGKADIRIINGVWYLKDPSDENRWPGIPIWSDHPGSFKTTNEENMEGTQFVGQSDIRASLSAVSPANAWPTGTVPKKFSYYEYDADGEKIFANTEGTVSYGGMMSSAGRLKPGHYASNNLQLGTKSSFCPVSATVFGTCNAASCADTSSKVLEDFENPVTCDFGTPPDVSARLLNATRSGFRLLTTTTLQTFDGDGLDKVLPMNFDLSMFQEALHCRGAGDPGGPDHPGELGCYFTANGLMKRPFNGIVYVTNTWNGSLDGLGPPGWRASVAPKRVYAPYMHGTADTNFNGTNSDSTQVPILHASQQSSLPFQLCSTSLATKNFDAGAMFKVPSCARYQNGTGATTIRTRTGAVRIVNGRNIDRTLLPTGLTLATNSPMFVAGDLNSNSDVSTGTAASWSPVMIAADNIFYLSNSWTDRNARWDVSEYRTSLSSLPAATPTTYTMTSLQSDVAGWTNENWTGRAMTLNGSRMVGHFSIYGVTRQQYNSTNAFSTTVFRQDPHLLFLKNQPPGVSELTVFTISGWASK